MKANGVPEKIYLQVCGDCPQTDCEGCKFEDLEGDITWCRDRIFPKDIEYTRTDAFIEKACDWLKENAVNYVSKDNQGEPYLFRIGLADAFLKAMKQ